MSNFVAIDFETANSNSHSICQVGIVEYENSVEVKSWDSYINPLDDFNRRNTLIHGIKAIDVENSPKFFEIYDAIHEFLNNKIVVSHGSFDKTAMKRVVEKYELSPIDVTWIDSTIIARRVLPEFYKKGYSLQNLAKYYGIKTLPHDALDDARTCGLVLNRLLDESQKSIEEWINLIQLPIKKLHDSAYKSNSEILAPNQDGNFYGISICITGTVGLGNRTQTQNYLASFGFTIHNNLRKDTDYLLDGVQTAHNIDASGKSQKEKDFEEKFSKGDKIRLITEEDLKVMCDVGAVVAQQIADMPSDAVDFEFTESQILDLLRDPNIEMVLISPDKRYKITYTTSIIAREIAEPVNFNRSYYLYDSINKSVMNSPWDSYVEKSQTKIIHNLIKIANYSMYRISCGWQIKCPKCSTKFQDAIWRNSPRNCMDQEGLKGCGQVFSDADKIMVPFSIKET